MFNLEQDLLELMIIAIVVIIRRAHQFAKKQKVDNTPLSDIVVVNYEIIKEVQWGTPRIRRFIKKFKI